MTTSDLTVKATVTNTSTTAQTGDVDATLTDPDGHNPIHVHKTVTLAGKASATVVFNRASDAALHLVPPQLWWPYEMGGQPLYTLDTTASVGGAASDSTSETFGIRT